MSKIRVFSLMLALAMCFTLVIPGAANAEDCEESHTWGEWELTLDPTADEAGEETRACEVCGETETRAVVPVGAEESGEEGAEPEEPELFTVVFVYGDGESAEETVVADQRDELGVYGLLAKPADPIREDVDGIHYIFGCWVTPDGLDFFGEEDFAAVSASVELTARWQETMAEAVADEADAEEPAEETEEAVEEIEQPAEEEPAVEPEEPDEEHIHSYGEPVWSWRRISGAWAALAAFRCDTCGDVQYVRADVEELEEPGLMTTTATVVFDGAEYTVSRTDELSYFVYLDGKLVNVYRLGEICAMHAGDGTELCDWYVNGELAAEGRAWFSFIVTGGADVTTEPSP